MTNNNLKQKAVSGMIWTALQRYSSMFINFISGIILARLLTPYDYGCIGMLSIFMVLAESFIDGGFGSALIQKKRPTQEDYSTIFFWNIGMAVLLYGVLYFSAPLIASFYNIPLLSDVLRVQGVILFIYAFNIVQRNQLQKKLNFKVLSIVTIFASLTSLVVTIFMAYYGFGVWALVSQNIITAAIPAIVFWLCIKWRPKMTFSWCSFRELFSFGSFMFLTHILNQFGNQFQGLLIGKMYNPSIMGYYSKATSTERLASLSISQVMTQVTYPIYAEVQDDKERLGKMIKRFTMSLSFLTFPLMSILLLCAKPLFIILYTDRWIDSVPYFQILCIAGLAYSLQSVNYQSISAIGKSKEMFIWTLFKRAMGVLFVILGILFYGMQGLLIGMVINTWFSYFVNIYLVSKYIGYYFWDQLKDIMPVLFISLFSCLVCYIIGYVLQCNLYVDGVVKFVVFVIVYLTCSYIFRLSAFQYFKSSYIPILIGIKAKLNRFK